MQIRSVPRAGAVVGYCRLLGLVLFGLVLQFPLVRPSPAGTPHTVVVSDDPGGAVAPRIRLVERYRSEGVHVEIRGRFCMSACTLYLGLTNTCVTRDTAFGFHGPASPIRGIGLSPKAFDYWSRRIAAYYPEPLRSWYINEGRNMTMGFQSYSGSQLIRMGVPECQA